MTTLMWVVLAVIAVTIIWLIAVYNGLIKLKTRTEEAWSDIDVQLKRRYDLIPNLIDTVKGYATHERELLENVTKARTNAMNAGTATEQGQAENMLTDTLKSLFAVAENYPDLKANQNFAKLQDELSDTENKIQAARRFYNGNVRDFNIKLQVFPTNIIAKQLGFEKRDFFEIDDEREKEVPKVNF